MSQIYPLVCTRGVVILPGQDIVIDVGREVSLKAVDNAQDNYEGKVILVSQKDVSVEDPGQEDLFGVGTLCEIRHIRRFENFMRVKFRGLHRAQLSQMEKSANGDLIQVDLLQSIRQDETEEQALVRMIIDSFEKSSNLDKFLPKDVIMELSRGIGADQLSDKSVAVLPLALERKQTYLETLGINDRLEMLIQDLEIEKEMDEAPVLILEGGAMRGLFTAGVLDAFMDHRFYFKKAAGISAGTLQGLGYLSKQCGRSVRVNSAYAADPRYMGFRHMLKGGSFFNFDFMFGPLAHEEDPFDFETFEKAEEVLYAVITDCLEGKPHFISSHDLSSSEFMKVCEASCSIPLVSKPVDWRGKAYVDGGVGMPLVPLPEEIPFPHGKIVYILTRDVNYRKKPVPFWMHGMLKAVYGRTYPAVVDGMCSIPERYNRKMERVIELEKEGAVFVIRPENPVTVSRTERDAGKLRKLHGEGYRLAMDRFDEMMRWLHEK